MQRPSIETIDTHQFCLPESGAVYLIQGDCSVLIEAGTAASADQLLDNLHQRGIRSLKYVFLTHIHLDHAGGAGQLAQAFPEAKIVVHERGARHLANPQRLIEGVRLAAPDLFQHYGMPLPVPEQQLMAVSGGEVFDVGARLEVIATPGHAPHHVCYYEQENQTLFTGDAVGNWNIPVDVPLTVPPRFDLALGLQTLQNLRALSPKRLAFTHFGIADNAISHLERYERQLVDWFDRIRDMVQSHTAVEIVQRRLTEPRYSKLSKIERDLVAMCIHGAVLSLQAGTA